MVVVLAEAVLEAATMLSPVPNPSTERAASTRCPRAPPGPVLLVLFPDCWGAVPVDTLVPVLVPCWTPAGGEAGAAETEPCRWEGAGEVVPPLVGLAVPDVLAVRALVGADGPAVPVAVEPEVPCWEAPAEVVPLQLPADAPLVALPVEVDEPGEPAPPML